MRLRNRQKPVLIFFVAELRFDTILPFVVQELLLLSIRNEIPGPFANPIFDEVDEVFIEKDTTAKVS